MFFSRKRVISKFEPPSQAWGSASPHLEHGRGSIWFHAWGLGVGEGFPCPVSFFPSFLSETYNHEIFWFVRRTLAFYISRKTLAKYILIDVMITLIWSTLKEIYFGEDFLLFPFFYRTMGPTFFLWSILGEEVHFHPLIDRFGEKGVHFSPKPHLSLFPYPCKNFDRAWFSIRWLDLCPL